MLGPFTVHLNVSVCIKSFWAARKSIKRSIDQSINQSIDQSINRSINQSINQSIKGKGTLNICKFIWKIKLNSSYIVTIIDKWDMEYLIQFSTGFLGSVFLTSLKKPVAFRLTDAGNSLILGSVQNACYF